MRKVQLNYFDVYGERQHTLIDVPDDVDFSWSGAVSITHDTSHVVVEFRAPWNGELVRYSYRNPDRLEVGDIALTDINGDTVVGTIVQYGTTAHKGQIPRATFKPASRVHIPSDHKSWA